MSTTIPILVQQTQHTRADFYRRYVVGSEPAGVVPMPLIRLRPAECMGCWPWFLGWPEGKMALEHATDERCGGASWVQFVHRERARLGFAEPRAASIQYDCTSFATPCTMPLERSADLWGLNHAGFVRQFRERTWNNGPLRNALNDLRMLAAQPGGLACDLLHGLYEGNDVGHAPLNAHARPVGDACEAIYRDVCMMTNRLSTFPASCRGEVGYKALVTGQQPAADDWYWWFSRWVADGIADAIKHAGYAGRWVMEYMKRETPKGQARAFRTPDGKTSHHYWFGAKYTEDLGRVLRTVPGPIYVHVNLSDGSELEPAMARIKASRKVGGVMVFNAPFDGCEPSIVDRWNIVKVAMIGEAN